MDSLVKIEGTLEELKALFVESAVKEAKSTAKKAGKTAVKSVVKTATKRKPSDYNRFMKKELTRLKKLHPKTKHQQLFKKAAKAWSKSKKVRK